MRTDFFLAFREEAVLLRRTTRKRGVPHHHALTEHRYYWPQFREHLVVRRIFIVPISFRVSHLRSADFLTFVIGLICAIQTIFDPVTLVMLQDTSPITTLKAEPAVTANSLSGVSTLVTFCCSKSFSLHTVHLVGVAAHRLIMR